jgi:glycerol-3-phosphate acyltransferase PlsY
MSVESILLPIAAFICSYLLGSIPAAYLVARIRKGVDIRTVGSRNMGTMNVMYQVGFAYGLLVLVIDIGKGALAVLIAQWLGLPQIIQLFAGAIVVLGHVFPVFLKFRGGKGGATCIGVLAALIPWAALAYLVLFLILLRLTRFATLSYGLTFICFPIIAAFVYHDTTLVIYSLLILLIPGLLYIPRIKEMYAKGGSWRRVLLRSNLKDRL